MLLPWAVIVVFSTISAWRYGWGLPRREISDHRPPVAVIVAVKGVSPETRAFFKKLLAQAYGDFRIIAAVESREDPAFALITQVAQDAPRDITLTVAGNVMDGGQKVANLLAALEKLDPRDEIVIFTDADTLPHPLWVSRLVSALIDARHEAVTGYRWMIPTNTNLSSAVVAAANTSIVTLPRIPFATNLCWGGTMALRRETLERLNIKKYWEGAISDDLQMSRALKDHKIAIFSPRQSLLLSPVAFNWRSAFAFGIRQYRMIFTHVPLLWAFAIFCLITPILSAGLACLLAAQGNSAAILMLVFALIAGELRFRSRRRIARALWDEDQAGPRRLASSTDRWLRPLWWAFHAACALAAPVSRKISWAGIDYLVRGPQEVRVLPPEEPLSSDFRTDPRRSA